MSWSFPVVELALAHGSLEREALAQLHVVVVERRVQGERADRVLLLACALRAPCRRRRRMANCIRRITRWRRWRNLLERSRLVTGASKTLRHRKGLSCFGGIARSPRRARRRRRPQQRRAAAAAARPALRASQRPSEGRRPRLQRGARRRRCTRVRLKESEREDGAPGRSISPTPAPLPPADAGGGGACPASNGTSAEGFSASGFPPPSI
jgi:hypothetical protein